MLRRRLTRLLWLYRALIVGDVIGVTWNFWPFPASDLTYRAVHDALLFILVLGALVLVHGRNLGWSVDRTVPRNTLLLALLVLPLYLVELSLPSI